MSTPFKMKSPALMAGTKGAPIQASYSPTKFVGGKHGLLQTVKRVGKKILGLGGGKKGKGKSSAGGAGTLLGSLGGGFGKIGGKISKPRNAGNTTSAVGSKSSSSGGMFSTKALSRKA